MKFVISIAAIFDIPSAPKTFLKPSMQRNVIGCFPAKDAFAPEGLVTMLPDWVELLDVKPTLRVMLHTMIEFATLML